MTAAQYRLIREALQLSRPEIAEALSVERQSVWQWETGKRPIPPYVAKLIRAYAYLVETRGVAEARRIIGERK